MAVTYHVTHRTDYQYAKPVTPSYGQLHILPRDLPGQTCLATEVTIDPAPDDYRERSDYFGNRVAYFAIQAPHRRLTVTAESTVEVNDRQAAPSRFWDQSWEEVRDRLAADRDADVLDASQFVLESRQVPRLAALSAYAAATFVPGRRLVEAAAELSARIHADFSYKPGSTSVSTPLAEVFEKRTGVCQDFAHVGIGCLRALGLASRYVSGYLETRPPPGQPKLAGADVSHAWFSLYLPGAGWIDLDPTNDQFVNDRYVTTAWGRDYGDVPPLNGVIYTTGKTNKLKVSVDVVPVGPA